MRPKQWIEHFLQRRGLGYADISEAPRPLYRYHLQDDEFESLKKSLQTAGMFGFGNALVKEPRWDAAFVLYAAEWRREYDGGQLEWRPIFASFKGNAEDLTTFQRNLKVEGQTRYLGSLAIEGGRFILRAI